MSSNPHKIVIAYWGRRGALPQFTYQFASEAIKNSGIEATLSVSRQNPDFERYLEFGSVLAALVNDLLNKASHAAMFACFF